VPTPIIPPNAQVATPFGPGSFGQSPTPIQRELDTAHAASIAANASLGAPLSNSAMEKNSSDPVRDGELVVQETDVDLTGAGMRFRFQRTYRNRVQHFTALGWGWDFNYNRRIITPNDCGDVDLVTGDSGRVRFTVDGSSTPTKIIYDAPASVPFRLTKLVGATPNTSTWQLLDGDNLTWTFDGHGLLRTVADPAGRGVTFTWQHLSYFDDPKNQDAINNSPAGSYKDVEWAIQYAEDNLSKKRVNFIYDDFRLSCLSWDSSCTSSATLVFFTYKKDVPYEDLLVGAQPFHGGRLAKVGDAPDAQPQHTGRVYSYWDPPKQADTFLSDDAAAAFCTSACGNANDCHATALCQRPTDACIADFTSAVKRVQLDQPAPSDDEEFFSSYVRPVCISSMMYVAGCSAPQAEEAGWPWLDAKSQVTIIAPYCEFQNQKIADSATCDPGIVPEHYLDGDVTTRSGKLLSSQCGYRLDCKPYDSDKAKTDYSKEFCYSAVRCDPRNCLTPNCTPQTTFDHAIAHACVALQQRSTSFCAPDVSCYDSCLDRYRQKDTNGGPVYAYGRWSDLKYNLKEIQDTSGKVIQHNEYGADPSQPSFDKVTSQQLGDDPANTLTFYYVDLARNVFSQDGGGGVIGIINYIPRLPIVVRSIGGAMLSSALGAPVNVSATVDQVYALSWKPALYVKRPYEFKSVYACPATCSGAKPKPTTTIVKLPPLDIVHGFPGAKPVVSHVGADGRVVLRTTAAQESTTTPAKLVPFKSSSTIEMATEHGKIALRPTKEAGVFEVSPGAASNFGTPEQPQLLKYTPGEVLKPIAILNLPPFPPDEPTRATCGQWSYQSTWVGSAQPAVEPQLPAHAVVIHDLHGVIRTEYYDANERVLREVNQHNNDGRPSETTDYNYDPISGALQGVLYPDGQRTCTETNALGAITQTTQIPAPNAAGNASQLATVFVHGGGYAPAAPSLLTDVVRDPASASPAGTHLYWYNGRVTTVKTDVDANTRESTSYSYDGTSDGPRTITLPSGAQTRLDDYTAAGPGTITRDSSGIDPIVEKIAYDGYGWPSQSGRANHTLQSSLARNAAGWMLGVSRTMPNGGWLGIELDDFDPSRQPRRISTPDLNVAIEYDTVGHPKWQIETPWSSASSARATCFSYSADGRLDGVLRPEGNLVVYHYDDADRLVEVDQGFASTLPDWANACVTALKSAGKPTPNAGAHPADFQPVRKLQYDGLGHLVNVTDGGGIATTFINDGFGRPIDAIDAKGNHFRKGYDSRGRVVWEAAYGPNAPSYERPTGLSSSVPLLSMVEYEYDNLDRIRKVSNWHFAGAQPVTPGKLKIDTITTYDDVHSTVSVSVDGRAPTVSRYDGVGRLISRTLPDGLTITGDWKELAPTGDQVTWTFTGADGKPRTRIETHNDAGALVQVQDGAGNVLVSTSFDDEWREATRTVGGTLTSTRQFDAFGRLLSEGDGANPSLRSQTYGYDGDDRVHTIIDANKSTTTYFYDGLDRLRQTLYPDGKLVASRNFVDGSNRPHDVTDAFGTTRTFQYDPVGNVELEHVVGAAGLYYSPIERAFTHDPFGHVLTATMQGNTSNPTNGSVVTLSYDSLGNRISESNSMSPIALALTWDPMRGPVSTELQSVATPSLTSTIAKAYDARGRLSTVAINKLAIAQYTREPGQGKISYGAGSVVEQPSFDTFGRQVGVDVSIGGQILASLHDSVGVDGIARERQRRFGSGQVLTDAYEVDGAGRVTEENLALSGVASTANTNYVSNATVDSYFTNPSLLGTNFRFYQLDGDSNWLSRTDAQTDDKAAFESVPAGWNQYQQFGRDSAGTPGATWSYTAGNATQIGADTYGYDSLGQLIVTNAQAVGPRTVGGGGQSAMAFGYDALGRRVLEIDPATNTKTTIVWDGDDVAAYGTGSNVSNYVVRVGGQVLDEHLALVGNFGGGQPEYLHQTADGSVLAMTDDAQLLEGYAYSSFGEVTAYNASAQAIQPGSTGWRNRFLYQGQLYDPSLRAYAMRAREYRPDLGRFLSPDPMGIAGGENLYGFVFGKALSLSDPFGLSAIRSPLGGSGSGGHWYDALYVDRGFARRGFDYALGRAGGTGWGAWGWGVGAGLLAVPTAVEEIGRGLLNTPHSFFAGGDAVITGLQNWRPNGAWYNQVDDAARIVAGGSQVVLAVGSAAGIGGSLMSTGTTATTSVVEAGESAAESIASAQQATTAANAGKTVLGHFPEYLRLAESEGANVFNIPSETWNALSEGERWAANQAFLDQAVARGDQILLATPPNLARAGSYFARELEYLAGKGYVPNAQGTALTPGGQ